MYHVLLTYHCITYVPTHASSTYRIATNNIPNTKHIKRNNPEDILAIMPQQLFVQGCVPYLAVACYVCRVGFRPVRFVDPAPLLYFCVV